MNEPRFALIDHLDCIFYDSDSLDELLSIQRDLGKDAFRGIFDYQQNIYLDECDMIDILGVQIHSWGD